MRRICLGLLVSCVAALGLCAPAGATTLSYTFDSGRQGWMQNQDQRNLTTFGPAGFRSAGGNPGGHLEATDTGPETGCSSNINPCQLLTFYSPIVPILGGNYDGTVSFDLRSPDVAPQFAAELLVLPAGLNYLDGLIPLVSNRGYNHFSISLNETANWSVCPFDGGDCLGHPTQLDLRHLLGAADQFAVMVDVAGLGPDGTGETYYLDNFVVTDGPPAQPTPTPTPTKCKKGKKGKKSKKRAAAAKKKKCKKKKKRSAAVGTLRG